MKIASIANGHMTPAPPSRHSHRPTISALHVALHRLSKQWSRLQIAIALSEAGDTEGAAALLAQPRRLKGRKSKP